MSLDVKVPLTCVTVGEACQCCLCRAVKQCEWGGTTATIGPCVPIILCTHINLVWQVGAESLSGYVNLQNIYLFLFSSSM